MRFRSLGFIAEGLWMKGDPESAILEHAKEWRADLIVVGSHDCSRIERFLIGSIAESVVKHAPLKHRAGVGISFLPAAISFAVSSDCQFVQSQRMPSPASLNGAPLNQPNYQNYQRNYQQKVDKSI
jgi:hypothetical protein